jgi:hypothetical protein
VVVGRGGKETTDKEEYKRQKGKSETKREKGKQDHRDLDTNGSAMEGKCEE